LRNTFKITIIIIAILFSGVASAKVSWPKAIAIYNKLIKENYLKRPKALILVSSGDINAWVVRGNRMYITTALLDNTTPPELALVLGHELAHIQYRDAYTGYQGKLKEDRADHYGSMYAYTVGYSKCKQALFFLRLYQAYGNQGGAADPHSSNLKRFWRLYKYCNKP
jgi:hypothetical protein